MKFIKFCGLLLLLSLVACSPLKTYIKADTTAFYKESFEPKGSVVVLSGDINLNNSLEFDAYKQKVEAQLSGVGFTVVTDVASADYAALLLYGVDDGEQSVVYTPIYGQTGPNYVVACSSLSTQIWEVNADSLSLDAPLKVFEGRTISSGKCSVIVEVFDELLEAMFSDFPGENGRNRVQRLESEVNCQ